MNLTVHLLPKLDHLKNCHPWDFTFLCSELKLAVKVKAKVNAKVKINVKVKVKVRLG